MKTRVAMAAAVCSALAGPALGQSLFRRATQPVATTSAGTQEVVNASLRSASLMYVEPPKPREFIIHGQVTIIIDETSRASSKQTLDAKKDYNNNAAMTNFPSVEHMLQLQLQNGDTVNPANLDVNSKTKFKGEGEYDRADRFNAKITAEIIDVKPNGVLVLEARKSIIKDKEVQTLVLSGRCRQEDITTANTVLSSQLADLAVVQHNEGQVKDTATKGLIPRFLETLFNF